MGIHLLRGETIIWKSFPGTRYRLMVLFRDVTISIAAGFVLAEGLKMMNESISTSALWTGGGIAAGLGLLFSLINQLNFLLVRYYITNERVLIKKGFLNVKLTSIKHEHIVDTKVTQRLSDRVINTGTIFLFTANDTAASQNDQDPLNVTPSFQNIDEPFRIHQLLEENMDV